MIEVEKMTWDEAKEWAKQSPENYKAWMAALTAGKLKKNGPAHVESANERAEWADDQYGHIR